jgi:hypothetical protein
LRKTFSFDINARMFQSLPLTVRKLEATEARLESIYNASRMGLKGDALALAAGMLPTEYRQLCQFDPLAEMAALKGKADAEAEMAKVVADAARGGDYKAALAILNHRHDWTPKQEVSVDVTHKISITEALRMAQERVSTGLTIDAEPANPLLKG